MTIISLSVVVILADFGSYYESSVTALTKA